MKGGIWVYMIAIVEDEWDSFDNLKNASKHTAKNTRRILASPDSKTGWILLKNTGLNKVMPDKTLVYHFRNDVDQIVMLDDVR